MRRKTVIGMNGILVSHDVSSRMGEQSCVKLTTTFPWWSQACKQPNTRPKLWTTGKQRRAVGDHELRVETELPESLQPLTEGLTRGSSSSTDVSPADVAIPPPALLFSAHPPAKLTFKHSRTHESHEGAMQKKSRRSGGQNSRLPQ